MQSVNSSCNNNQNLFSPLLLQLIEDISMKMRSPFLVAGFFTTLAIFLRLALPLAQLSHGSAIGGLTFQPHFLAVAVTTALCG